MQVCGKEEALSKIESINIPASELSIDGATEKIEKAFDITDYLPEGVELIDVYKRQMVDCSVKVTK